MTINAVWDVGPFVVKQHTRGGDAWTAVLSRVHDKVYEGRHERYATESSRMRAYSAAQLPVPEVIFTDPEQLMIGMTRVPGKKFSYEVVDRSLTDAEILRYLSKSAEVLRQVHEHGEHGDPYLGNFFVGNGDVHTLDFEHTNKRGKVGELASLYISTLVEAPWLDKEEVKRAIVDGYGTEPQELWTPWSRSTGLSVNALRKLGFSGRF